MGRQGRQPHVVQDDQAREMLRGDYPDQVKASLALCVRGGRQLAQRCLVCAKHAKGMKQQVYIPYSLLAPMSDPQARCTRYLLCEGCLSQGVSVAVIEAKLRRMMKECARGEGQSLRGERLPTETPAVSIFGGTQPRDYSCLTCQTPREVTMDRMKMLKSQAPKPLKDLTDKGARTFWTNVHKEYTLEDHHKALLDQAAFALQRATEARQRVDAEGLTLRDSRNGRQYAHPLLAVERDARALFLRCLRETGLDLATTETPRPPSRVGRPGR